MPPSIAACLRGHHVLWILASTQGKDDRRVQMTKVVLLYRTNLPCSVKTRPWRIRTNRLPKLLQDLQFLLLAEHHLASGAALELEDEFGSLTPKLLLDLPSHPIEACGDLLLVSTREPDARALRDFRLYGDRSVGHLHRGYASNDVLLFFHVAGRFETESKRYGVTHPVAVVGESLLWQVLLEYFCGGFTVDLVDDVALGSRHLPLTTYWDTTMADGPTSLCRTREQGVGDPSGNDFVVAILIGRLHHIEVIVSSPAPKWEELAAREVFFQPCKQVIKVAHCNPEVTASIREDEQANGVSRQVGEQVLGYPLPNGP